MSSNAKDKARLRSIRLAERTAKSHYFVSVYGTGSNVQPYDMRGRKASITMSQALAVERAVLPWVVVCYALCRHPVDGDYIKSTALSFSPCRQNEINKALSQMHYDWMVRECNVSQVLTLAWIATTAPEPSDAMALRMFGNVFDEFDVVTVEDDGRYITNPRDKS